MRYMLMCCIDEDHWESLETDQRDGVMRDYGAWIRELEGRGRHVASGKLQPTSTATTITAKNGKPITSDGPFAETKEQLGGYHVIDCANLDEALATARRIPTLRVGGKIEVRPLVADG